MLTPSNYQTPYFNNAINQRNNTHIRITTTLGSTTYTLTDDDVHSSGFSMRSYLNGDTDLCIGKAMTKEVSFKLIRTANVQNTVLAYGFNVEIGVELKYANGQVFDTAWVNLGKFYPIDDEGYYDENTMDVVAYDCMSKFDIPADEWLNSLTYPMTVAQMFSSLCTYVGVTGEIGDALTNMKNRSFASAPIVNTGLMCRDVLELIAEACGCYAKITPDEHCRLVWFTLTNWNFNNDMIFDRGIKQYMSQVSGLNVKNTEDDIGVLYPTTATEENLYVIVDNPFLVTANSTEETNYIVPLYNRLKQYNHYPFTLTTVGNPLLEAGDIIYAKPSNDAENFQWFPVYIKEMVWNGACTDLYQSTGNRVRKTYTSAVKQKLSIGGRYHIFKNDIDTLESEIADVAGDVTLVDQKADSIALSAGKKARMWYSNTAPTGTTAEPLVANVDYWIDTAHDRKLMRWTGSAWAAADDISKYTKYSGIDINQNGVDITGGKYVKIVSGSSVWTYDDKGLSYTNGSNGFFRITPQQNQITRPSHDYNCAYIQPFADSINFIFWSRLDDSPGNAMQFTHNGIYMPTGQSDNEIYNVKRVHTEEIESNVYLDLYGGNGLRIFDQYDNQSIFISPFADGTMEMKRIKLQGSEIIYKGTKANSSLIRFVDNTADAYGNGIVIGDGGLVVIGAGESAAAMASGKSGGDETLYLGSDGAVLLYTNVQNGLGSAKQFQFNTSGTFSAPGRIYQNGNQAVPLSDTWRGMQQKTYSKQYTIAANGDVDLTASDFGVSTPSGYTPVAVALFNSGSPNCIITALDIRATGSGVIAHIKNFSGSQWTPTAYITILYLQN